MGYNENRKRSKYGCWTVPMSDWNLIDNLFLNKVLCFVEPYLWEIETSNAVQLSFRSDVFRFHWTVPMRDWNFKVPRIAPILYLQGWTVPTSEQCALYTVINVDEKERKPEQLMSVRQIWIVRVFYFFVAFMRCVLIVKICRYVNRFGDGKCYDRYIKRAWIKIFIVWVFSDSEQIL